MTSIAFTTYLATRPVAVGTLGAGDKLLVFQGGALKTVDPTYSAVALDAGGSGKRALVGCRYIGLDDNGNDIWQTEVTTI